MRNNIKPTKEKHNIYLYTVCKNRPGTMSLLQKEGYKYQPKTPDEAATMLADVVKREGEEGLKKIAMIHPDRELILSTVPKNADGNMSWKNADNDTQEPEKETKGLSEKTLNTLIIGGAVVLTISLITVIATNK